MNNLSEEEQKAIDKINRKITIGKCEKNIGIPVYISDLETVLNLIEKQSKEIEQLKIAYKLMEKEALRDGKQEIETKDNMIDAMSEEIFIKRAYAITCEEDIQKLKERIKEEYRKKV